MSSSDEYEKVYNAFRASTETTRLVNSLSIGIFENMPKNIFGMFFEQGTKDLVDFLSSLTLIFSDQKRLDTLPEDEKAEFEKELELRYNIQSEPTSFEIFSENLFDLLSIELLENIDDAVLFRQINFEQIFSSQKLVMLFAHLDAYLSDSLDIICKKEIKVSNLKSMQEQMVENFVTLFDRGSIKTRLHSLKRNLKIKLDIETEILEKVYFAEQVRHIYIHNAGKIDRRFIKYTKRKNLKEGEIFSLSKEFVNEIHEIIKNLVDEIHKQIRERFFL